LWWALLLGVWAFPIPPSTRVATFAALAAAPLVLMLWRKRSLRRAAYSVVSWCFNAAGMVRGLLRHRRPAKGHIASRVIQEPPSMREPHHRHYA
jgi:hypothetical protein